jgi:hypothetical protein
MGDSGYFHGRRSSLSADDDDDRPPPDFDGHRTRTAAVS